MLEIWLDSRRRCVRSPLPLRYSEVTCIKRLTVHENVSFSSWLDWWTSRRTFQNVHISRLSCSCYEVHWFLYKRICFKCIISNMKRTPVMLFFPSSLVCSFCSWSAQYQGDGEEESTNGVRSCLYFTQVKWWFSRLVVRSAWKNVHKRHLSAWHRKGFLHREHIPPVAGTLTESSQCPLPVKLYLI